MGQNWKKNSKYKVEAISEIFKWGFKSGIFRKVLSIVIEIFFFQKRAALADNVIGCISSKTIK